METIERIESAADKFKTVIRYLGIIERRSAEDVGNEYRHRILNRKRHARCALVYSVPQNTRYSYIKRWQIRQTRCLNREQTRDSPLIMNQSIDLTAHPSQIILDTLTKMQKKCTPKINRPVVSQSLLSLRCQTLHREPVTIGSVSARLFLDRLHAESLRMTCA